jgi:hypothetical protein
MLQLVVGDMIIPLKDCKDRHLYKVVARNFRLGVFDLKNKDFIGIRHKCGDIFLDRENHSESCVRVLEELEKIPDHIELKTGHFSETEKNVWNDPLWIDNIDLFTYLDQKVATTGLSWQLRNF